MAADLAVIQDVADRWRPLATAEVTVASVLLREASAMLRLAVPGIDARMAVSNDLGVLARGTVAEMVRRVLVNPEGWREESVDDYRRVRDTALSSGALYLADFERAQLHPQDLGSAFVISLAG